MNNTVNSFTSWQPLEEVIVGRAYSPDYFDFIDNAQVRNQLQQILAETEEDLSNLQRTIEQYGATVLRPDLPDKDQFVWFQTEGGGAPLPPLTPRDWQISLGDKLLRVLAMPELDEICAYDWVQLKSHVYCCETIYIYAKYILMYGYSVVCANICLLINGLR
jgi:hypothetical protein